MRFITVHGEKGGGGGGGRRRKATGDWLEQYPEYAEYYAQRGAWFTKEGLYYLHRGEMVLPRNVAEWFRKGGFRVGSKVINVHNEFVLNNPVIRSEADIDELAEKISRKMVSKLRVM